MQAMLVLKVKLMVMVMVIVMVMVMVIITITLGWSTSLVRPPGAHDAPGQGETISIMICR